VFGQRLADCFGGVVTADEALKTELQVFEQHKHEWLKSNPGEFVVIVGTAVAGFFRDYETAFRAGLERVDVSQNFLVKQVWAEEPVYLIY
jgi:hypothetical protein